MNDGVRFDNQRAHVESYFLKINAPDMTRALWIKATILAALDREPIAESWMIAFERGFPPVATKETVPLTDARFGSHAIDAHVAGLTLTRNRAHGESFDLEIEDASPPFIFYPYARMYTGRFPSSKITSPMPSLVARGTVRAGDRTWKVDGWRGLLGHNWGRGHAFAYAWGHCNVWDDASETAVFEGMSARVRVGPILTPTTTLLTLRTGGETHMLTHVRELARNRGAMTFRRWMFSGKGPNIRIRGELSAETNDMVGLHYENPDGAMTYCLNSKLASARIEITERNGRTRVLASRGAALEIGTRDPHHGVTMVL